MSSHRVLPIVMLLSAVSWSSAVAGPVTGQTSVQSADPGTPAPAAEGGSATDTSFTTAGLFDAVGLPLLRTSAPLYLHLQERPKLRNLGQGGYGGGGGDGGAGGGGGVGGIAFDPGAPSIGNVGFEYGQGTASPLPFGAPNVVPEPALLLLMTPALVLALRRRARRQHSTN